MRSLGLVGFGRFGAAFAQLCEDAGCAVRAFDPAAAIPDALRASSLEELAAAAEALVLAVPVPELRAAALRLRPFAHAGHIVFDVGSVKTVPVAALREAFGAAVPWVGTHPLFGPASLARGERPLRVVVSPTPEHPAATARVQAFYESIGCEVIREDAEAHDRAMASSHALAFFVAKGLVDAGVRTDVPYAPPSFQGIARTIDAVRSDAGHLFAALHRENPYAAESRRQLLDALEHTDRQLREPLGPKDEGPTLAIPALAPDLRETRELIDEVDRELCALLARRVELARRAGRAKASLGRPVRDPVREADLLTVRRAWAEELDLDPDAVTELFEAIVRFSRRVQGGRESA